MSLLSLYSKIQLKIEKAEEKKCHCEEERRSNLATTRKEPNNGIAASAFLSLRSFSLLAMTVWRKFLLLFWKTLKIAVRFWALLFNDSAENYLIFTRLNKDSVIICNNSFCQYKRFEKKVRFYSKTAFAGILICTIITSSVLYLMMPKKPSSQAATFTWEQTDWSGGADTENFPDHSDDQTGWTKFYSKGAADVSTSGEMKLERITE